MKISNLENFKFKEIEFKPAYIKFITEDNKWFSIEYIDNKIKVDSDKLLDDQYFKGVNDERK